MSDHKPIVNDEDIASLFALDKTFVMIFDLYGPPTNWSRPEGFVSLSKMIFAFLSCSRVEAVEA